MHVCCYINYCKPLEIWSSGSRGPHPIGCECPHGGAIVEEWESERGRLVDAVRDVGAEGKDSGKLAHERVED